jgi:hypothetical protein
MSVNIGLLLVAIVLAPSLTIMVVVSNPAFAGSGFKNKAECMEYVIQETKVVRNHIVHNAKVNTNLAEKLCAEY